jgi:hypothetical protein
MICNSRTFVRIACVSAAAQSAAWRKFVTRACLASDPAMATYSPIDKIHAATAPILIVAGEAVLLCRLYDYRIQAL